MDGWARAVGSFTLHIILEFKCYNDNDSWRKGVVYREEKYDFTH
jgi:hypothetical protein